ncbi:hypothetical protein HK105_207456 [Polyrhizophydium stewartii]|uniref:C3HC-type domain-containing protein n=1 Tax=Polyrhizophydium stewartii TaxID=2732419 RepID=A0ABR4N0F8_9FUNG
MNADDTQQRLRALLATIDSELVGDARVVHKSRGMAERVGSFLDSRWSLKPAELSPLVCAARGWTNSDRNTLRCDECGSVLVCNVQQRLSPETVVQGFVERLTTHHKDSCRWRRSGVPPSDLVFPQLTPMQSRQALLARRDALERVIGSVQVSAGKAAQVVAECLCQEYIQPVSGAAAAMLLAALGWESATSAEDTHGSDSQAAVGIEPSIQGAGLIKCALCQRVCGLWLFSGGSRQPGGQTPPAFDALSQHRWFCPWIVPTGEVPSPGWQQTLPAMKTLTAKP